MLKIKGKDKMLKKLGIIILTIIVIFLIISGISYIQIILDKVRTPENYDAPDNEYHKNGEGFYYVGYMLYNRISHTATLLQDGRVFIAGGTGSKTYKGVEGYKSTELFDIKTGRSMPGPDMHSPRREHRAFLLKDGRILIYGGYVEGYMPNLLVELYDPATNTMKIIDRLPKDYAMFDKDNFIDYVSEHEVMFGARGLYNLVTYDTKTEKIRYASHFCHTSENYYIGKINDVYYFYTGYSIDKFKRNNKNKYMLTKVDTTEDRDHLMRYRSIFLKDGERILIVSISNLGIYNIKTKKFTYTPEGTGINDVSSEYLAPKNLYLLSNGHVIAFSTPDEYNAVNVSEIVVNGEEVEVLEKPYMLPYGVGVKTDLGNDRILYSGGQRYRGLYDVTNKVYIWKSKGVKDADK